MARRWKFAIFFFVGWVALVLGLGPMIVAWDYSRLGPLHRAAKAGDVAECERLVKSGIVVDTPDPGGDTALDWAIYGRHIDVVRALLDLGADVNHADDQRRTPLMFTVCALRGKRVDGPSAERNAIARLLIGRGADVNRTLGDGQTTLHLMTRGNEGNAEMVRILVAAGADRDAKTADGHTPLQYAKSFYAADDRVIAALEEPKR
jgi:ankyrin repeat protein